jgi:hypothetical protein
LDHARAGLTKTRASKLFGAHFSRPPFANELAEKVNWLPKY